MSVNIQSIDDLTYFIKDFTDAVNGLTYTKFLTLIHDGVVLTNGQVLDNPATKAKYANFRMNPWEYLSRTGVMLRHQFLSYLLEEIENKT